MKLTIKERLIFNVLYPKESNIINQTLIRDLNEKIKVSQEEMKAIDFKVLENGSGVWSAEKAKSKDKNIEFTNPELTMLKNEVDKLDEAKKITQEILPLVLKIKDYKQEEK